MNNNHKTQFIAVETKKNKRAKTTKAENSAMDVDSEENWPPALSDYVAHSFALCRPGHTAALEKQLKAIILQAQKTEMLHVIDWNERRLPRACTTQENPNSAELKHKLNKQQNQAKKQSNTQKVIKHSQNADDLSDNASQIVAQSQTEKNEKRKGAAALQLPKQPLQLPKKQQAQTSKQPREQTQTAVQPLKKIVSMQPLVSKIGEISLTPEELRKRELRALRFQQDTKNSTTSPSPTPTTPVLGTVIAPAPVAVLKKQKQRHQYTPIVWETETAPPSNDIVVGTSTDLEKPYFRLTSAADPATVRPLPVLRKAFNFIMDKWKQETNYSYICEQFKSMRQDLTVQRIRNDFTVTVYETHARIALKKGDLGEYNQCQTQLKYLYEQDIPGSDNEFLAYRILYLLFSENESEINALLEELASDVVKRQAPCVKHALMVRSAMAKGNYYQFFKLYKEAPNMGAHLLNQFVDRVRIDALIVMCKAYQLGVPLVFVSQQIALNKRELIKFLRQHGVQVFKKTSTLDTKAALPILLASRASYKKVDIKGQI